MSAVAAGSFEVRGIIEGFYGVPWTHEQRLDMLDFMATVGMNTFVYSPKDDVYLRRRWREPYGGAELEALRELVSRAGDRGIDFSFCLSPGLSMQYSSADDFEVLVAKFAQLAALGVTSFGLLLDDIPGELQHPADRERFASLVDAQVDLVGRLFRELRARDASCALLVCPTVYWGRGDEPYLARLGAIDPEIDLLWTGRAICSAELDLVDAERFAATAGRPPLYWDNFPVNDVAMKHELHIGPYLGRDRGLPASSRGIIANGMPLAEASKIAFSSAADYTVAPAAFDPEESWNRALRLVGGERDYETLRTFADAFRGSCLCADDAPQLVAALDAFAYGSSFGDRDAAVRSLAATAGRMRAVADSVLGGRLENAALQAEVRPWAEQYARGAAALGSVARLFAASVELDVGGKQALRDHLADLRAHGLRAFGDALDMFLSDLIGEYERD